MLALYEQRGLGFVEPLVRVFPLICLLVVLVLVHKLLLSLSEHSPTVHSVLSSSSSGTSTRHHERL